MALIQVWPASGVNVDKEGGVGHYAPGEWVEKTLFVRRRLAQRDLFDHDPGTDPPYIPFIDEKSTTFGRLTSELSNLRGRYDLALTVTVGLNTPGDGSAGIFYWDEIDDSDENGSTIWGVGVVGRWKSAGLLGGGGGGGPISPLTALLDADGFRIEDIGNLLPRLNTLAYAASVNIDVRGRTEHTVAPLTGDTALVLINPVDGAQGLIELRQDSVGGRSLTGITCAGRTIRFSASADTLQINQSPNQPTLLSYAVKSDYVFIAPAADIVLASYGPPAGGSVGSGSAIVTVAKPFASSITLDFQGVDRFTYAQTGPTTITSIINVAERGCLFAVTQLSGPHALTFPSTVKRLVGETLVPFSTSKTIYALSSLEGGVYISKSGAFEDNGGVGGISGFVAATLPELVALALADGSIGGSAAATMPGLIGAAAGSAGAGYQPTDKATCIAWFKLALANVTLSSGNITAINDLSTANHDVAPASFGAAPLWIASDATFATHGSVQFDRTNGDGEGLRADGVAAGILATTFSVSCAVKFDSIITDQAIWAVRNGANYIYVGLTSAGQLSVVSENATLFALGSVAFDGNAHIVTAVITPRVGATAGSITMYVDGAAVTLTDSSIQAEGPFTEFYIGMYQAYPSSSRIAEMVIYNEQLDATETRQDALFLAAGKGITIP